MNKDWMEYTAADLEKMSEKELVDLLENMPKFERTSDEIVVTMDVGIHRLCFQKNPCAYCDYNKAGISIL